MNRPTREQFRFFTPILTRWGDVDRIGHINNAKYITYDEQARTEYFGARLAQPVDGSQASVILARITCNYLEQLHHPATIDYGMRVARFGRTSLVTQGALFVGESCYSFTECVLVWFDYAAQRGQDVPAWVRQTISDYEVVKPEQ